MKRTGLRFFLFLSGTLITFISWYYYYYAYIALWEADFIPSDAVDLQYNFVAGISFTGFSLGFFVARRQMNRTVQIRERERQRAANASKNRPIQPVLQDRSKIKKDGKLRATALYDYTGDSESTISFKKHDVMVVVEQNKNGWWLVNIRGKEGWVPSNFIEALNSKERYPEVFKNLDIEEETGLPIIPIELRKLPFIQKNEWFRDQLRTRHIEKNIVGDFPITVGRETIFQDSFEQVLSQKGEEFKKQLNIKFRGEEGLDWGGVTREWFNLLTKHIFNPEYGLFKYSAPEHYTFQPNPLSGVNEDHLLYFKFCGRIVARAIYEDQLIDCYFTRFFYKHILGRPIGLKDMEQQDPEFHRSLKWILDNENVQDYLDLTFSTEYEEFGAVKEVDLKPNGSEIEVSDENKAEYVQMICEFKLSAGIKEQTKAFLSGFYSIIPFYLISVFDENELELLISGLNDIDIGDWEENTVYNGYNKDSQEVQWFWRAAREFDGEDCAKLLAFATGTTKVPLGGFSALAGHRGPQKFQISKVDGKDRLPVAHTCFNTLDLPQYTSFENLKKMLKLSITEGAEGFGLK